MKMPPLQTLRTAAFAAPLFLFLAGCDSKTAPTPANFTQALNTFYVAHTECLFSDAPQFPYETHDPAMTKKMDALTAAELLTVQKEAEIHVSNYTPTPAGTRALPKFCYGHRVIASIDSFTPPAPANGFDETKVAYHYTMEDVPTWAKTPQVEAAFPAMTTAISGSATGTATLAKTMTGWQVPE